MFKVGDILIGKRGAPYSETRAGTHVVVEKVRSKHMYEENIYVRIVEGQYLDHAYWVDSYYFMVVTNNKEPTVNIMSFFES